MNPEEGRLSVSFIVLALNEAEMIERTVEMVIAAVAASSLLAHELILVDDGSTDRTGEIMDRIAVRLENIRVIHNESNLGFGGAYLRGVEVATQEYVMIIAGDNIMPIHSITAILDSLGSTDIVLPFMTDDSLREPLRRYGSWTFTRLINLISGYHVSYYNAMVVRRRLFARIRINATGYSLQAECVVKFFLTGATYSEIGVAFGHSNRLLAPSSKALQVRNLTNLIYSLTELIISILNARIFNTKMNVR